jgi:hypothetical protein
VRPLPAARGALPRARNPRALALALLAGCSAAPPADETPMPGQAQALAIVWQGAFQADQAPPPIAWSELRVDAGAATAVEYDGRIYSGVYTADGVAMVAWRGSFHASAFAHELMHAWQADQGIVDPLHQRREDWQRVDAANDALVQAGL